MNFKRFLSVLLAVILCVAAIGCTPRTPEETTPDTTTPESIPEETPAETDPEGVEYNVTYDLDGGIDGGNPTVYNNAEDMKLIAPIRVGYDFIGWTGTGVAEPTVSVTIAKGTEGDLSFKANWKENGEFAFNLNENTEDLLGKALLGKANAAIVVNGETYFENKTVINPSNVHRTG